MSVKSISWVLWAVAATGCSKDVVPANFGNADSSGPSDGTAETTAGIEPASTDGTDANATTDGVDSSGGTSGVEPPKYDLPPGEPPEPQGCDPIDGDATVSGTVTAPEGTIPIPGALVFVSPEPPAPIPSTVYCDECVALDCRLPHALTQADGTFEMSVISGEGYLVVQKGQFRRVTPLQVDAGAAIALEPELTRLPAFSDAAAGLSVPRIALGFGIWDPMENLLAALMGTEVDVFFQRTEPGFDIYHRDELDGLFGSDGSFHDLLNDLDALRQYHIVFAACYGDFFTLEELENLRTWVSEGGRLYATDLEADSLMRDGFGEYQTFGEIGSYSGLHQPWPGRVEDEGLLAWLSGLGYGEMVDLHGNATQITALHEVLAEDQDGNQVDIGHRPMLSAQATDGVTLIDDTWAPAAVMGQLGCGRVAYTTYHTHDLGSGGSSELSAQELSMLYIILELGVCQEFVPEPEG